MHTARRQRRWAAAAPAALLELAGGVAGDPSAVRSETTGGRPSSAAKTWRAAVARMEGDLEVDLDGMSSAIVRDSVIYRCRLPRLSRAFAAAVHRASL